MDTPLLLSPLELEIPPFGETPFEELVVHYFRALHGQNCDGVLLHGVQSMSVARAAALAARAHGLPFRAAFTCTQEGETPIGMDCLAALIVMEGMGADSFGLCCSEEVAWEHLTRLAPYAALPLFWMDQAGIHDFPYEPVPHDPDIIPCASGMQALFITADVDVGEAIECSPDLLEDIIAAEDEPVGALKIAILEPDDLDIFAQEQYAIKDALCLWSDVPELMESALRLYQGRAFYDGTGDLPREFLAEMSRNYGLVVL